MASTPVDYPALLKDIPSGAWVAISVNGNKVVAYAAEIQTAIDLAHERGETDPLVVRVPEQPISLIL
jgi:hypothetical protein